MSYDLWSFQTEPKQDPLATIEAILDRDDEELDPARSEQAEALERRVVEVLASRKCRLIPRFPDFRKIARRDGIPIREARRIHRYVEMDVPGRDEGIRVTVYGDHVQITVPYWHHGAKAKVVFTRIIRYLRALHDQCGFAAYDPQTSCILNRSEDFDVALNHYLIVMGVLPKMTSKIPSTKTVKSKKPRKRSS